MPHTHVTQAIEAYARGEIVVVTDDDDRENEGDLVVAAVALHAGEDGLHRPQHLRHRLRAPDPRRGAAPAASTRWSPPTTRPLGTAFTVTVDVKHGLTTGISAEQRCNTVRALANGNMGEDDFVRPGHVFPLIAKDGGVLMRSGHTEAAVDLCKLAEPAAGRA